MPRTPCTGRAPGHRRCTPAMRSRDAQMPRCTAELSSAPGAAVPRGGRRGAPRRLFFSYSIRSSAGLRRSSRTYDRALGLWRCTPAGRGRGSSFAVEPRRGSSFCLQSPCLRECAAGDLFKKICPHKSITGYRKII